MPDTTKIGDYRELAVITRPFLGFEDGHGIFTAGFTADYGGSAQPVGGYNLAGDSGFAGAFIRELLRAVGVRSWDQLEGKPVFVIQDRPGGVAIGIEAPAFVPGGGRLVFEELASTYRQARESGGRGSGAAPHGHIAAQSEARA